MPLGIAIMALTTSPAWGQAQFSLTIENNSLVAWDAGVLAVMPEIGNPNALLPLPDSPTSGDPYDTYTYVHQSCDPSGEDDGDALLLISRWPTLTLGVNAWVVGPLTAGQSQVVSFTALPGDVMSFVARVPGSGDDGVYAHDALSIADPTVDLFDLGGAPLAALSWSITGMDVNNCANTCPPIAGCLIAEGGNARSEEHTSELQSPC